MEDMEHAGNYPGV